MVNIMDLVIEQQDKMHGEYNGGFKYGGDYEILKAIVEYKDVESLVVRLVKSLKDKVLMTKVKSWMTGV